MQQQLHQIFKILADIKSEISWISMAAIIVAIASMSACSDLDTIARQLKVMNANHEKK